MIYGFGEDFLSTRHKIDHFGAARLYPVIYLASIKNTKLTPYNYWMQ